MKKPKHNTGWTCGKPGSCLMFCVTVEVFWFSTERHRNYLAVLYFALYRPQADASQDVSA